MTLVIIIIKFYWKNTYKYKKTINNYFMSSSYISSSQRISQSNISSKNYNNNNEKPIVSQPKIINSPLISNLKI
jgi:hypothetical protein